MEEAAIDCGDTGSFRALGQQRNDALHGYYRLGAQRRITIVCDGMSDNSERIARQPVYLRNDLCAAFEAIGHDGDGRDAEPLGANCVVQTAR